MGSLPNFLNHAWPTSREHERRLVDTPVQVRWNGKVVRGWCNNLCIGGVGFTVAAPLHTGDRFDIEFQLPDAETTVQTTAVLRWSDGFRHGCEFLILTAEAKKAIAGFLSRPEKKKLQARKQ